MEHDLVIEGKAVTPVGLESVQVAVDGGLIAEIRRQGLRGSKRISAGEALIFPGFIDPHVHLREPGWEQKEDFATGTAAAVHGGVTTVFDMPNNPKPATGVAELQRKAELARAKALIDVRFFGGVGEHFDAVSDVRDLVVGYKIYLASTTGNLLLPEQKLRPALDAVWRTGKPASLHCEDQSTIEQRERALAGEIRPDLHSDIRPPEAEVESVRKVLEAVQAAGDGGRVNLCHLSVAASLGLVTAARGRGGVRREGVKCEVALHHLFFSRKDLWKNPLLEMNPPLREEHDRSAMVEGLRSGEADFLVTDHAPHLLSEKREGACGLPGLDNYGNVVAWLIKGQGVNPSTIARVSSENQAKFFRLEDRGRIEPGKKADLVVLDLKRPEKVDAKDVRSKCGWTPYEGYEFPGRVRWTISGGRILLDDFQMVV